MDSAQLKSDASAALVAGHFAKAGALFASYCATAPTDRQSLLRMGDAWARAGERVRAIDAYLAAAQGFAADGFLARAIAASKLVLELEPGHQRMQRILADLYAQRGVGPGVARRPRAVAPPPPASPPLAAPETPAPARATEEEAAEMVVTEFLLDTVPERSLEEALAEAVSPDGVAALASPAAPAAEPAPPMAAAPPMLFPVPEPADEAAAPAAAAVEPAGARFLELSLDETELTPAPAPPPVLKPAVPRFALAEPGPPPPAVAPAPAPAAPPLAQAAAPEEGDTAPEPAQPEARYIDLSFDDDEPLEAAPAETPPSADTPLEDEPLAGEGLANGNGAEALARTVPKAPLFSDLSSEAFVELVERCPLRRFSAGERILQQDAPGEAFYVICEGQVAVRREEETGVVELARLSEGDFFGEMALLSGAPRVASVDAMQDGTLVLEISTALLSELTLRHPGVATALKKFCRQRLVGNSDGHLGAVPAAEPGRPPGAGIQFSRARRPGRRRRPAGGGQGGWPLPRPGRAPRSLPGGIPPGQAGPGGSLRRVLPAGTQASGGHGAGPSTHLVVAASRGGFCPGGRALPGSARTPRGLAGCPGAGKRPRSPGPGRGGRSAGVTSPTFGDRPASGGIRCRSA